MTDVIVLQENLGSQERAMLGALYSRSTDSVLTHVGRAKTEGSSFMERFYVGYGHDSIGDMGECHVFFENVPLPTAVWLEHHPLFRGQECSTRYIDFSNSPNSCSKVGRMWLDLYKAAVPFYVNYYSSQVHPQNDRELRAVQAKAFDRARGLLPAGVHTNVAFYTTFRTAQDHLSSLATFPECGTPDGADVVDVAYSALGKLYEAYPQSFVKPVHGSVQRRGARFRHLYVCLRPDSYLDSADPNIVQVCTHGSFGDNAVAFSVSGYLDFASLRDLHRHRVLRMNIPQMQVGAQRALHPYYVDLLPPELKPRVRELLAVTPASQYDMPIGLLTPVQFKVWAEDLEYVLRLRAGNSVHYTLRQFIESLNDSTLRIPNLFGAAGLTDDVDVRRGDQTILPKV